MRTGALGQPTAHFMSQMVIVSFECPSPPSLPSLLLLSFSSPSPSILLFFSFSPRSTIFFLTGNRRDGVHERSGGPTTKAVHFSPMYQESCERNELIKN